MASWTDLLTQDQAPGTGGNNAAIAKLLLQQSFDNSPIQSPVQGFAKLAQAYVAKSLMEKDQKQQAAGNASLASALAPPAMETTGGGPSSQLPIGNGQSIDYTPPEITADRNTDKRAQLAQLLNSGAISQQALAPQVMQSLGIGPPKAPIKLGEGESLYDPTSFKPIVQGQPKLVNVNGQMVNPYDATPVGAPIPERNNPNQPFNADGTPNPAFQAYEANKIKEGQGPAWANVDIAKAREGDAKYSSPSLIEIDDGKGGTTQLTAQQDQKTGQWVTADEKRAPIAANNMRVVSSTNSYGGARSQVQMLRMLSAAHTIANELENVAALPGTTSSGWFGNPASTGGNMSSVAANLTRKVQPQEVQSYNTVNVGLSRALAQMEAAGLAPPGSLTAQMGGLTLQEGDTELTRLQKLATVRQTADGILDSVSNSPIASKAQKDEINGLRARYDKAIPFLPMDVINLAKAKNPGATLADVAKGRGLGPQGNAPAQDQKTQDLLKKYGIQ